MNSALQRALDLLAKREHSARELVQKLQHQGHAPAEIAGALSYCQEHDYQSDARFATSFCRVRIEQGYGPLKIAYALKQHGFTPEDIAHLYDGQAVDWCEVARSVLEKHAWRFKSSNPTIKQTRFLIARGFPGEVIRLSLKERSTYEDR